MKRLIVLTSAALAALVVSGCGLSTTIPINAGTRVRVEGRVSVETEDGSGVVVIPSPGGGGKSVISFTK